MASISKRSGNYRVEWRLGGRRDGRRQSVTLPDAGLAEAAKTLAETRRHAITDAEVYAAVLGLDESAPLDLSPTFRTWVNDWLKLKSDVEPLTLAEYRYVLTGHRIMGPLGHLHLTQAADRDKVRAIIAAASAEGLAAVSVRKMHSVLHQVFRDAIPKWIQSNPCERPAGQRTKGLPKVKRTSAAYLSPAEAAMVIEACDSKIRGLVTVMFATGLRLGELLALCVGQVHLDSSPPYLQVERNRKRDGTVGDPKSEAGNRPVDLSSSAQAVLKPRVTGKAPSALVFPAPGGGMWNPDNLRSRYWYPALIKAARCSIHPPEPEGKPTAADADPDLLCGDYGGIRSDGDVCRAKVAPGMDRCRWHCGVPKTAVSTCACPGRLHQHPRLHDGRHSHVDMLLDAGWDLLDVQLRIGHENASTTIGMYGNRKRRPSPGKLEALDRVLGGSGGAA